MVTDSLADVDRAVARRRSSLYASGMGYIDEEMKGNGERRKFWTAGRRWSVSMAGIGLKGNIIKPMEWCRHGSIDKCESWNTGREVDKLSASSL